MPYVSKAQQGYFHTHKKEIGAKVVKEFDNASKGEKNLPEHVKPSKGEAKMAKIKHDSDKSKEIGIPASAPPHVKAADKKTDKAHGKAEGHPIDKAVDGALMSVHKKSFAMGKAGKSGFKGIKSY